MSTSGKTPVSFLTEMLVQKNLQPYFNLIMSGEGTNKGLFIYEVTAGNVKARGSGFSKKEAKQEAAKEALIKLKDLGTVEASFDAASLTHKEIVSPYQAEFRENAVGKLGQLCASSQLPAPDYNPVREDGPPHAKMFQVACKVSSFEYCGWGRTKQQAKQMAAKAMLEALEKLQLTDTSAPVPPKPVWAAMDEDRDAVFESIHSSRKELGLAKATPQCSLLGKEMGSGVKNIWPPEKLAMLKDLDLSGLEHFSRLELVCSGLKIPLVVSVFQDPQDVRIACWNTQLIRLMTEPETTFLGTGKTMDEARNWAAVRALEYLRTVVWLASLDNKAPFT